MTGSLLKKLKALLISPTLLVFPDYRDEEPPLELHVEASEIRLGAMFAQCKDGNIKLIAFISVTFSSVQQCCVAALGPGFF